MRFPEGWDFEALHGLYTTIAGLLADRNNRVSLSWSVTIAALARIILDERGKARHADDWERRHK